jgi:hypothetical protein
MVKSKIPIIIIVPNLSPFIDGVGDYALKIAKKLLIYNLFDITIIIAGNPFYSNCNISEINTITVTKKNHLFDILTSLKSNKIFFNYVGYGYNRRGIPFWIYFNLQKWKKSNNNNKLVTTFHELYAVSFNPLTSSFWNQFLQRYLTKKIILLSDSIVTNKSNNLKYIKSISENILSHSFPVFSNIIEPENILFQKRKKHIVIFGTYSNKEIIYSKQLDSLINICVYFNITEVIDIGPKCKLPNVPNLKFVQKGILEDAEISKVISSSYIGIIGRYNNIDFAKSGVFAAYASHGLLIICLNKCHQVYDDLILGEHYLDIDTYHNKFNYLDLCKSVYKWYIAHSLNVQSEYYLRILCSN